MYIINDTYFQSPKYVIPNLEESDSKAFAELERLIDDTCRLFLESILTDAEIVDFNSHLVGGMFPIVTTGIPEKWIDLVNGKGDWKGLIQINGLAKTSLLVDLVYYNWLVDNVSYMSGFGDAKANPKGADNVSPTQRMVNTWNDFLFLYQDFSTSNYQYNGINSQETFSNSRSLLSFLKLNFVEKNRPIYRYKNQLGL
jgi:hypothetical protein